MFVIISCSGKFHAFSLAEQMDKHALLAGLFTSYAYQKNTCLRKYVKRLDKELIPVSKIHTNNLLAFPLKLLPGSGYIWLDLYDRWVASHIKKDNSRVFIGWSGMSLHSIKASKASGKICILERGSSHIVYQNKILQEEYKKFGFNFSIDKRIIEKELKEYQEADYISIPSLFVKNSFIENNVPEQKLILNPYGTYVAPNSNQFITSTYIRPFRIIYMGTLSIRKGLIYLFEALKQLSIPISNYEVWFLGSIDPVLLPLIKQYQLLNWKFFGHINHYDIGGYIKECDIGIQPSLEEGFSLVIPQLLSHGVPLIITTNTGGENIIKDGVNGFVVEIRDSTAIAEKINLLFYDKLLLSVMKKRALQSTIDGFTWDDYGIRYNNFLKSIIN